MQQKKGGKFLVLQTYKFPTYLGKKPFTSPYTAFYSFSHLANVQKKWQLDVVAMDIFCKVALKLLRLQMVFLMGFEVYRK